MVEKMESLEFDLVLALPLLIWVILGKSVDFEYMEFSQQ